MKATESLVSLTYSTYFLMGLTSIVGANYVGMMMLNGYIQVYSLNNFLNGSIVMQTNHVLN